VLLTFDDIARRLTDEKVIHIPKSVMQSGRGHYRDIAGVSLEEFVRKTGVKVRVLHRVDTTIANRLLYRNGFLKNYVEDYIGDPLTKTYEALPLSA
jgi:hypothetical protein